MARGNKSHRPVPPQDHHVEVMDADSTEGHLNTESPLPLPDFEESSNVSSEVAQEIWESLREEFYEHHEEIEQLPLSLHRFFALIGEQDKEVQVFLAELLPIIRSYVKLRLSIQAERSCAAGPARGSGSQSPHRTRSPPNSVALGSIQVSKEVLAGRSDKHPLEMSPLRVVLNSFKEEQPDVSMQDVSTQHITNSPRLVPGLHSPAKSTLQSSSSPHSAENQSQVATTRAQGVRETDATVPKSVPFPPRSKPQTTRDLLTQISFLMGEALRASEEKVGLATAAYDSVDRHVRALDTAIREHEGAAASGLQEATFTLGKGIREENYPAGNEAEGDDDDEPLLGMLGPTIEPEARAAPRLKRIKKRDRQDQRKDIADGQRPTHINTPFTTTHQEIPIDPYEPRYCFCNQVSYGEMIACDNPNCPREWFHLGCAGLAAPPKGKIKWYCRECEEALGRSRRRIR